MKQAQASTPLAQATYMCPSSVERATGQHLVPLYIVEKRTGGAWSTVAQFVDPNGAQGLAALLRSVGVTARVSLIPQECALS